MYKIKYIKKKNLERRHKFWIFNPVLRIRIEVGQNLWKPALTLDLRSPRKNIYSIIIIYIFSYNFKFFVHNTFAATSWSRPRFKNPIYSYRIVIMNYIRNEGKINSILHEKRTKNNKLKTMRFCHDFNIDSNVTVL